MHQFSIRLNDATMADLDAEIERRSASAGVDRLSRASVVAALIREALGPPTAPSGPEVARTDAELIPAMMAAGDAAVARLAAQRSSDEAAVRARDLGLSPADHDALRSAVRAVIDKWPATLGGLLRNEAADMQSVDTEMRLNRDLTAEERAEVVAIAREELTKRGAGMSQRDLALRFGVRLTGLMAQLNEMRGRT